MKESVKLSPPWIKLQHEFEAMFGKDPDIKVVSDSDDHSITLFVSDEDKADALSTLLPDKKIFGNVIVYINVVPANEDIETILSIFNKAFSGNPVFAYSKSVDDPASFSTNYLVFKKEVVQFFMDNLADANGVESMLYQDIARDIFGDINCIHYCTDIN